MAQHEGGGSKGAIRKLCVTQEDKKRKYIALIDTFSQFQLSTSLKERPTSVPVGGLKYESMIVGGSNSKD